MPIIDMVLGLPVIGLLVAICELFLSHILINFAFLLIKIVFLIVKIITQE